MKRIRGMLHSFNLSKNKSGMSLLPKVIVGAIIVFMISSGMIILPTFALPSAIPVPTTLGSPTGLKATLVSSTSIQLSWNAVPGASSYIIARSATTTGFVQIGTSTTTSYLDQTVGSNSCYEVASYSSSVAGHASGAVCISITPSMLTKPVTYPNGSSCIAGKDCQSGYCNYATHVCSSSSTSPTAPLTTTVTPPNPACQSVKTILTNSGYSATVIATVMAAMKCS